MIHSILSSWDSDSCRLFAGVNVSMIGSAKKMSSFENRSAGNDSAPVFKTTPIGRSHHLRQTGTGLFTDCSMDNGMGYNHSVEEKSTKPVSSESDLKCQNAFFQSRSKLKDERRAPFYVPFFPISEKGSILKNPAVLPFTSIASTVATKTENSWFPNNFKEDSSRFKSIQERNSSVLKNSMESPTPDVVLKTENSPFPSQSKLAQEPAESSTMPELRFKLGSDSAKFLQHQCIPKNVKIPTAEFVQDSNATFDFMQVPVVKFIQENGQRKYGGPPPGWIGPAPPKGCEVFIGKLPRDMFEDELMQLFQSVGVLYEFRLMMDFSSSSRGYAFATYTSKADAKMAIDYLDGYEIRPRRRIGVMKSVDNCKLYIGGVPNKKTNVEVYEEMTKFTEGVVRVVLYPNMTDQTRNRGFAFVEYESHRAASLARRVLLSGEVNLFNKDITVSWADPKTEVDEDYTREGTSLYVRNIPLHVQEDHLKAIFSCNGHFVVQKVKKVKDFAFVHFFKREFAEMALLQFDGFNLDGSSIEVTWAKSRVQKNSTVSHGTYRTELRHPFDFGVSNGLTSRTDLFNNPILLLHCICAEYGFGEPTYKVSQAVADQSSVSVTFTAQVSIPNWPFPVKQFVANGNLHSPFEAKQKVAWSALKSVEFYRSVFNFWSFPTQAVPVCNEEDNPSTPDGKQDQPGHSTDEYSELNSHNECSSGDPVSDLDLLPTAVLLANMIVN